MPQQQADGPQMQTSSHLQPSLHSQAHLGAGLHVVGTGHT
tara:strand:- start:815 stop:934 length:120 start_codon:yes stop_codon:yes gene_type:complete